MNANEDTHNKNMANDSVRKWFNMYPKTLFSEIIVFKRSKLHNKIIWV